MRQFIKFLLLSQFFIISLYATDAPLLNFFKTVDWSYMGDKTRFSLDLCKCNILDGGQGAGFKATIAEPIGMIETTNTPWNVVGIKKKFDKSLTRKQGSSRGDGENRRYLHFIAFPPLAFLNFIQDAVCFERFSSLAFLYWSEIVPTQTNDIYALFMQSSKGPLSKIWYNNPFAMSACIVDCAATTFDKPMNSLHWCAGCAGVTGNNTAYGPGKNDDPIVQAHVQALSAIDDLHYAGALAKVSNATFTYSPTSKIANSMCGAKYFPLAIKSQYALQLAYPTVWDATPIGKLAPLWADFKNKPDSEDDNAFWVWSIKDTCVGGAKCTSMFTLEANTQ